MPNDNLCMYFGIWDDGVQYMYDPTGRAIYEAELTRLRVPTPEDLNRSYLFLPWPIVEGKAMKTYLPAVDLTILSWWDFSITRDPRGNCHIIVSGNKTGKELWAEFAKRYPILLGFLKGPDTLD